MRTLVLSLVFFAASACSSASKPEIVSSPADAAAPPKVEDAAAPPKAEDAAKAQDAASMPDPNCGMRTEDWCPAPAGDPCGAHKNESECRADAACVGMQYRGESVVACQPDGKGFWTNCPAVGCVSKK